MQTRWTMRAETLEAIERHATETYPEECCGIVLADAAGELVRRIRNVQNELHGQDRTANPRDAKTAYFMDPKELFAVLRESDETKRQIRFFYHSHPEHGAYFSDEDKARAMAWDEPAYPDAAYVVVSVVAGAVRDRITVAWDEARRDFVLVDLAIT